MPRAVVCAYSPVGAAALEGLLAAGVQVTALYTYPQPDQDRWFEAPAAVAGRHGIPVHCEPDFNADAVLDSLRAEAPDLLFSFYFREMIAARALDLPRLGAFNLHGSLLPAYRGRAPINWALLRGETRTGITLHRMTPKPDDGDILAQEPLDIAWDETALSLTLRMAAAGREMVRTVVPGLVDGSVIPKAQTGLGPSSYFGGRRPSDSRLDFLMSTGEAFNQIRAVADPWPNAYLETPRGLVKIPWALPSAEPCPQGTWRKSPEGVLLGFANGALRLHALRRGDFRSERPSDHARWLNELDIKEA
nr:formyltransferase family protein [uncultured Holophaga sp.]